MANRTRIILAHTVLVLIVNTVLMVKAHNAGPIAGLEFVSYGVIFLAADALLLLAAAARCLVRRQRAYAVTLLLCLLVAIAAAAGVAWVGTHWATSRMR